VPLAVARISIPIRDAAEWTNHSPEEARPASWRELILASDLGNGWNFRHQVIVPGYSRRGLTILAGSPNWQSGLS